MVKGVFPFFYRLIALGLKFFLMYLSRSTRFPAGVPQALTLVGFGMFNA